MRVLSAVVSRKGSEFIEQSFKKSQTVLPRLLGSPTNIEKAVELTTKFGLDKGVEKAKDSSLEFIEEKEEK